MREKRSVKGDGARGKLGSGSLVGLFRCEFGDGKNGGGGGSVGERRLLRKGRYPARIEKKGNELYRLTMRNAMQKGVGRRLKNSLYKGGTRLHKTESEEISANREKRRQRFGEGSSPFGDIKSITPGGGPCRGRNVFTVEGPRSYLGETTAFFQVPRKGGKKPRRGFLPLEKE